MAVTVTVRGLPELKGMFARITVEVGAKVLKRGVSSGAKIVKRAVLVAAQPLRKSGTLARSIIVKSIPEESNATQSVYYVLARKGKYLQKGQEYGKADAQGKRKKRAESSDAYYAAWVERGHRNVARYKGKYTDYKIRGKGRLTGLRRRRAASTTSTKAHPFMSTGFASAKTLAAQKMVGVMTAEIKKLPGIS